MSLLRLGLVFAMGAGLSACATFFSSEQPVPRAPAFELLGRMAVAYDGRALSSGVRWAHGEAQDEIWLLTPTGQALAHIVVTGTEGAVLTRADGGEYRAGDVESLTRRVLGWELPLARLSWWVRGRSVPGGQPATALHDPNGRLVRLEQDGWHVGLEYAALEAPGATPWRLRLARDAHEIRLVIDAWR